MNLAKRAYKIAHTIIRIWHRDYEEPRTYSPKTHSVIFLAGQLYGRSPNAFKEHEISDIYCMPDTIWQAAKAAVRNTVKADSLEALRSKRDYRFNEAREKLYRALVSRKAGRRVVHKKIIPVQSCPGCVGACPDCDSHS